MEDKAQFRLRFRTHEESASPNMGDNKPPGPSPPSRASQDSHRRNTTTNTTTNPVPQTESMADTHVRPQRSTALATSSCLQLASQAAVGDGGGSDCKSMLALACCDCGGCRARLCSSTPSRDEMVVTCVVRSPEAQHAILDLRRKGDGSPPATAIRPSLRTDKLDALHHSSLCLSRDYSGPRASARSAWLWAPRAPGSWGGRLAY